MSFTFVPPLFFILNKNKHHNYNSDAPKNVNKNSPLQKCVLCKSIIWLPKFKFKTLNWNFFSKILQVWNRISFIFKSILVWFSYLIPLNSCPSKILFLVLLKFMIIHFYSTYYTYFFFFSHNATTTVIV